MEAATLGLKGAIPIRWVGRQLGIDGPYLGHGFLCVASWIGRLDGIAAAHERNNG
jgi:hypothetical protein